MERMNQKVGIVGLGLIGASLAKALSHRTDCTVYGLDIDPVSYTHLTLPTTERV